MDQSDPDHHPSEVAYPGTYLLPSRSIDVRILVSAVSDMENYAGLPRPELGLAPAGALLGMETIQVSFHC